MLTALAAALAAASTVDWLALPIASYNSDDGLAGGAVVQAQWVGKVQPYRVAIGAQVLFSTSGVQSHYLRLDVPRLFGSRVRFWLGAEFHRELSAPYYGLGNKTSGSLADHPGISGDHAFSYGRRFPLGFLAFSLPFGTSGVRVSTFARYLRLTVDPYPGSLLAAERPPGTSGGEELAYGFGILFDRRDHENVATRGYLLEAATTPAEVALSEIGGTGDLPLRLRIHDSSRFEWTLSIPLPAARKVAYDLRVQLEVPTGAVGRQNPWEQLQTFSRLDGPTGVATSRDVTVDAVRRGAVTLTQMLARARDGFARHCKALFETEGGAEAEGSAAKSFEGGEKGFLLVWLEAALKAVHGAREKLVTRDAGEAPEIVRERELADEFVSVRLLEMLAESQRSLNGAARGGAPSELTEGVRARIDEALHGEFGYRERKRFLRAQRKSEADVDAYLARAARLKKHFEEVLFLDRETEQLDERVQQWMATVGALLGGIVAFVAIQVALTHRRPGPLEVGWGLSTLAMIAGLGYAARHHMREWGRGWLAGKMVRFHAQRISRCRVPSRRLPSRDVIVEAREWCHEATTSRPDPLNPEAGASLRTTHVRYLHKGVLYPQRELASAGVRSVRHIFRYDLSPLFP